MTHSLKTILLSLLITIAIVVMVRAGHAAERPTPLNTYQDAIAFMQKHNAPGFLLFTASWCGPCKQLKGDTLAKLMPRLKSRYVVYYVDVDKEREIAQKFNIQSMPTYLILSKGAKRIVGTPGQGYRNEHEFIEWFHEQIGYNR